MKMYKMTPLLRSLKTNLRATNFVLGENPQWVTPRSLEPHFWTFDEFLTLFCFYLYFYHTSWGLHWGSCEPTKKFMSNISTFSNTSLIFDTEVTLSIVLLKRTLLWEIHRSLKPIFDFIGIEFLCHLTIFYSTIHSFIKPWPWI